MHDHAQCCQLLLNVTCVCVSLKQIQIEYPICKGDATSCFCRLRTREKKPEQNQDDAGLLVRCPRRSYVALSLCVTLVTSGPEEAYKPTGDQRYAQTKGCGCTVENQRTAACARQQPPKQSGTTHEPIQKQGSKEAGGAQIVVQINTTHRTAACAEDNKTQPPKADVVL